MPHSYNIEQAYDHLMATFDATWSDEDLGWAAIEDLNTEEPKIHWENTDSLEDFDSLDTGDKPWLRVYVRHVPSSGDQQTFGGIGERIFNREGILYTDIHVPVNSGLLLAHKLSRVIQKSFEGKRGVGDGCGIIFRRVRPIERGVERRRWFVISVLANFEYDEVI